MLGLCYVGVLGFLEVTLLLLTFWCHAAFTAELRWTFFEVIVE